VPPLDWNDNSPFRHLFDHLGDAVFLFEWTEQGEPGRFVEVNSRACQLLGYTRDELLTLSCAAIQSPERSVEDHQRFRSLAAEGHLLFQTDLVTRTGSRIPVETNACLVTWNNTPAVLCIARDLMARQQIEVELQRRLNLERLIADISTRFAHSLSETFETMVRQTLQIIGEFIAADRCYLTILKEGTHIIESSLDWCAPGIESAGTRYNGIGIDRFSWTLEQFERNQVIQVDDVSALPPAATAEKEIWSRQGIRSLVAFPLISGQVLIGYLGFNIEHEPVTKKWSEVDFRLLRVMADIFTSALVRKRYEEQRANLARDLERIVMERTAQLEESEAKFRALAHQVIRAQEEERHHISRELHDEAGQSLNVLKIRLSLLRTELSSDSHKSARRAIDDMLNLVDHTLESVHTLAQGLRPAGLEMSGLHSSLEEQCHTLARQTNLAVNYQGESVAELDDAATIALYRFTQEALTNVLKHAHARQVWVTLARNAHHVTLTVRDDGQGFDPSRISAPSEGLGLKGMRERIEMLGGQLAIESRDGQGTCLTARVPLEQNQ
jgi:PAS domain S-box-containing protein